MKELTQEEKRIKIAEACGWMDISRCTRKMRPAIDGVCIRGTKDAPSVNYPREYCFLPDYFKDLNAMHEAEKILKLTKKDTWNKRLVEIANGWPIGELDRDYDFSISSIMGAFSATADQRAEAFGKTLNLW